MLEALAAGTLSRERYDSFLKLQLEIRYLRKAEKRAAWQDRKKSDRGAHRVFSNAGLNRLTDRDRQRPPRLF